jgi:hypothetical protein
MLTSDDFVGMSVGITLIQKTRYQHAVNGREVPKRQGPNQALQAF